MGLDLSQLRACDGDGMWAAILQESAENWTKFELAALVRGALAARARADIAARLPALRAELGELEREAARLRAALAEAEAEEKRAQPAPYEDGRRYAAARAALADARRAYSESKAINGAMRLAGEAARLARLDAFLAPYADKVSPDSEGLIAFFRTYELP